MLLKHAPIISRPSCPFPCLALLASLPGIKLRLAATSFTRSTPITKCCGSWLPLGILTNITLPEDPAGRTSLFPRQVICTRHVLISPDFLNQSACPPNSSCVTSTSPSILHQGCFSASTTRQSFQRSRSRLRRTRDRSSRNHKISRPPSRSPSPRDPSFLA